MSVRDADTHKLSFHPKRILEWLETGSCYPIHAELGITNRCNHKCVFCTLDWAHHGGTDINTDVMIKTLEEMSRNGLKSIYLAGEGEPTLHKGLPDILSAAKSMGIKSAMSTNGAKMTEELSRNILPNLSWIRYSVDAATPDTYAKIHGVNEKEFEKVMNNIALSASIKKELGLNVEIGVQTLFMPETAQEVELLCKIVKPMGVDNFQVKPAHNHPGSSYKPGIYDFSRDAIQDRLAEMQTDEFTVVVRVKSAERLTEKRNYTECHGFHFYALIDAHGDVVPCNIFYGKEEYTYGNINEQSFDSIWNGDRRKEIIEKIAKDNHCMCGNYRCRFDVMNRYLERVKNPEVNDVFI